MSKSILSVFVDESGDFGPFSYHSPYYIVSMVLHNEALDISHNISMFESHLTRLGFEYHLAHAGPLIRKEEPYVNENMQNRRFFFTAFLYFTKRLPINYLCIKIPKRECPDEASLIARLSKAISVKLRKNTAYFRSYNQIIVYYDFGQVRLTKILVSVFNSLFSYVDFRKAIQAEHKLLQCADLICTMELLAEKAENGSFSKSETEFFGSPRNFRKNYLKHLRLKRV